MEDTGAIGGCNQGRNPFMVPRKGSLGFLLTTTLIWCFWIDFSVFEWSDTPKMDLLNLPLHDPEPLTCVCGGQLANIKGR